MEYTVCSFPPTHPAKPTAVLPPPLHTPARAVRRAYMKAPRQRYVVVGGLWLYAFLTKSYVLIVCRHDVTDMTSSGLNRLTPGSALTRPDLISGPTVMIYRLVGDIYTT